MALDEPKETDESCELDGVKYMADMELLDRLGRISVDFVEKGWRAGFVVSSEKPIGLGLASCGGGSCSC